MTDPTPRHDDDLSFLQKITTPRRPGDSASDRPADFDFTDPAPIASMSFVPEVLTFLDGLAEGQGWDRPAGLFGLFREQVSDSAGFVGVADFPGWEAAFGVCGHSFHALRLLHAALGLAKERDPYGPDLSSMFALALVDEAWTVKDGPEARGGGPVSGQPGAAEIRFVLLLGLDGSAAQLTHRRDTGKVSLAAKPGDGRLLDGMRAILFTALAPDGSRG